MKTKPSSRHTSLGRLAVGMAVVVAFAAGPALAQNYTRADNGSALNTVGAWVETGRPSSASHRAIWNAVAQTDGGFLNDSPTWGQIRVLDPGYNPRIFSPLQGDRTLTLAGIDGVGIDMSNATRDLIFGDTDSRTAVPVILGASQKWDVGLGTELWLRGLTHSTRQDSYLNLDVHTLTVDGAGTTRIDCPILGAGTDAIIKAGTGTLMFGNNAANNYEGTTIINDGTLLVNGTHTGGGLYTVHGDGTLGGTGTIHSAIDVLGTLAPGASVGELTVGGDLTLDGASLLIDLWGDGGAGVFGTGHDLLSFTSGQLFLDDSPQIAVDLNGFDPAFGNSYTIVDGFENELTGGFDPTVLVQNEPPAWGGKSFQIDYHYNSPGSIALTVVPEPGAWLLALIAAVCGLLVRRRR